jgi:hypothetical protein
MVLLIGCGTGSGPGNTGQTAPKSIAATVPAMPEVSRRLSGTWRGAGTSEDWISIEGRLAGVGFTTSGGATREFEVMFVHPVKGKLTYTAMPKGTSMVDFAVVASLPGTVKVFNPKHDHPKQIVYHRNKDKLTFELSGDNGEYSQTLTRTPGARATELEKLDRAFAADSASRGGAAWAERFEAAGANWSYGAERRQGHEAIKAMIDGIRGNGLELVWTPSASGLSLAKDMGYTVGVYKVMRGEDLAARGFYVSIWRRDQAGAWKIAFDTGLRTDNL